MSTFYKIINKSTVATATDELLTVGNVEYRNPSLTLLHKLGFWPEDPEHPVAPSEEDGYRIFDDGYCYIGDGNGGKYVSHRWRKLLIVDDGYATLQENQEIVEDRWEETETEYRHIVTVYDVVDENPVIDETTHHLKEKTWELDPVEKKKTAHYNIVRKIDNVPDLADGQEVVESHWAYNVTADGEEVYEHFFHVMTVVRNEPELAEGEQIVDTWYEDDYETNTRTYFYKVMTVVDNRPDLAEGQEIVNQWFDDDEESHTRTFHYEVRNIVDERPELESNDSIEYEWWDDDGVTRTHRYEVHRHIDNPPVLSEGQDIVEDHWDIDTSNPYLIIHTRVYSIRNIVDTGAPELDETHFVYSDYWNDDGVNKTHIYDVWELVDEERPDVDETAFRVIDLGIVDDPENKRRGRKWMTKEIVRNKPDDDPDGNFKYVEDGEEDKGDYIEILYRRVDKVWRRISKLKLEAAVFQLGLLDRYDAYIDSLKITNELGQEASARRFYDQANELLENHPMFKPYYSAGLTALGLTEEQGEALLEQCVCD